MPAAVAATVPVAAAPSTPAETTAILELKPPDIPLAVGQEARFEIVTTGAKDLYGIIVTLGYDPKVVEFKNASEGAVLKKDSQQTSFLFSNNIKAGTIDIYMTRIGDVGGVDGSGNVCNLVFQGRSGGASEVKVKSVKLTNFNREPLKVEARGAKVIVK